MKNSKTYYLNDNPIPLARHRSTRSNHMYDPQVNAKLIHSITLRNQHNNLPLFQGPLKLEATFFMPIPVSRKKQDLNQKPHSFKPDLDNLVKFLCDVSNGILYKDDCQIYSISAIKQYALEPKTIFTLTEIE
jgi:Holliday junction resolvase RusA-like endonuclease